MKKLVAVAMFAVFALPFVSLAQSPTPAQIQAQINSLLAEIQVLQQQLVLQSQGTASCHTFQTNLGIGSSGSEVNFLHSDLVTEGLTGTQNGNFTGSFDEVLASAVSAFQEKYSTEILSPVGLTAGTGYVGPSTRAKLNSLYGCGSGTGIGTGTGTGTGVGTGISTSTGTGTGIGTGVSTSTGTGTGIGSSAGVLSVAENGALAPGSVVTGTVGAKIGSYVVTGNNTEAVQISTLTIQAGQNASMFQNLRIMVNGVQFGFAQGLLSNGGNYTFSGNPLSVVSNGSIVVDVYADVLSSGQPGSVNTTSLTNCSGVGQSTSAAYSCNAATGQTFTVTRLVSNGTPSVTFSSAGNIGSAVSAGTASVLVGQYSVAASTSEGVAITSVNVTANTPYFQNMRIFVQGRQVGQTQGTVNPGVTYAFSALGGPITIPAGGAASVQLFADVLNSASGFVPSATAISGCTAFGVTSAAAATCNSATGQGFSFAPAFPSPTSSVPVSASVSPTSLSFFAAAGSGEITQQNIIFNASIFGTTFVVAVSPTSGWLSTQPVPGNGALTLVRANATGLSAGTYNASVIFSSPSGQFAPITVPVSFVVALPTSQPISALPSITNFSPASAPVGTTVVITGTGFMPTGNYINFGGYGMPNMVSTNNGTSITFVVPPVAAGSQSVYVGTNNGVSQSVNFIVNSVAAVSSVPSITNFSPASAPVGTTVVITGTGFTPTGNYINFGGYGMPNMVSTNNGTVITFVVPPVAVGSQSVYVGTLWGTSQTMNFNVTQNTQSTGKLFVTSDPSQISAGNVPMGSVGNALATFRFTETSNAESVRVTQVTVHDAVSAGSAQFSNLTLWSGSTLLASVGGVTVDGNYLFQLQGNQILVPQAGSVSVTLKGDANAFTTGATDNQTNTFSISSVTALGQSSNTVIVPTIVNAVGNPQTLIHSGFLLSTNSTAADGIFTPSNHFSRQATDDLAEIRLAANSSGGVVLTKLSITFNGSLTNAPSFLSGVKLLDSNGIDLTTEGAVASGVGNSCDGLNCVVTWTIPTTVTQAQISGGTTGIFKLRINDNLGAAPLSGVSLSLNASIQNAGDLNYLDSLGGNGTLITSIPTNLVPISIASFALPPGN